MASRMGDFKYELEDLPGDVKDLRVQDLRGLINDNEVLVGLRDHLPPANDLHDHYATRCLSNKSQLADIKGSLQDLAILEKQITELRETEGRAYQEWLESESRMYSKSRPYTRVGMEGSLRSQIEEYRRMTLEIEKQLTNSTDSDSNFAALVKQYSETQGSVHYYQELLNHI